MKISILRAVALGLSMICALSNATATYQQAGQWTDIRTTTLYTSHDRKDKNFGKASFSFQHDIRSEPGNELPKKDWDIKYGYASINGSSDYFGVSMISNDRSRIKDLGKLEWRDIQKVPVLRAHDGINKGIRFPLNGEPVEVASEGRITKTTKDHMYVAHIKDDDTDLYVLFRVEELASNAWCRISWKVVPSPEVEQ